MSVTSDVADLMARVQQATGEMKILNATRAQLRERLTDAASPLGISVYVGTIATAGEYSDGSYWVQFDDTSTNSGYASAWPQWAFELAQSALLAGKEVLLLANGDPFGSNLVLVLLMS
jgi:hypothetical protein